MRLLPLRKHRRAIPIVFLTMLFLLVVILLGRISFVSQVGESAQAGLYRTGSRFGDFFGILFVDKANLMHENDKLKQQLQLVAIDRAQTDALVQENTSLKTLLEYSSQTTVDLKTARILSRSPEQGGEKILIDRGMNDGVELNQAVIADEGILVGRVIETRLNTSIVQLVTDTQSRFGVRLLGDSNGTIGIAEGSDGTILHIAYIPQDVIIDIGTIVVSSGLDPNIPEGLTMGIVSGVTADEHDPFQTATVEPIVDLRDLLFVQVLSFTD